METHLRRTAGGQPLLEAAWIARVVCWSLAGPGCEVDELTHIHSEVTNQVSAFFYWDANFTPTNLGPNPNALAPQLVQ